MNNYNIMVVSVFFDRELIRVIDSLLAYQRDSPIRVRIVSPNVTPTKLKKYSFMEKVNRLIKAKNAVITLLVNTDFIKSTYGMENYLQNLADIGVKVHHKRELHAKIVLLETKGGRGDKGLLIMSANITETGLHKQQEVGIYFLNEYDSIYNEVNEYVNKLLKYSAGFEYGMV